MKLRLTSLALVLALVGAFVLAPRNSGTVLARDGNGLLKDLRVQGTLGNGGTFTGFLTITELRLNRNHTRLLASGVLSGVARFNGQARQVSQESTNQAITLSDGTVRTQTHEELGYCQILYLEIGPINLELLGVVVIIPNPIIIDVRAYPGPGNLLGNLLCVLAHLLDPRPR